MSDRAISTVADVSMALLLVSASVGVLYVFTQEETAAAGSERTLQADRTAEALSTNTIAVEYSLDPVGGLSKSSNPDVYSRVSQGTGAELLADAAVAEIEIGDTGVVNAGDYERQVDLAIRNSLQGGSANVRVVAIWRPHEGSSIVGKATAGRRPPVDAEVSTARLTVSSGVPAVADGDVEAGYARDDYEGAAEPIARAIVRGYFPRPATQYRLEQLDSLARQRTVERYQRFGSAVGLADYPTATGLAPALTGSTVLERTTANANRANEALRERLTDRIATDLEDEFDGGSDPPSGAEIADSASTGEVTIIVRTW